MQPLIPGERVLDHGMRPLGEHDAAYLLEATPGENGEGSSYHARYLTLAGGSGHEVTCPVKPICARSFYEELMKPVCDRVLVTGRFSSGADPRANRRTRRLSRA